MKLRKKTKRINVSVDQDTYDHIMRLAAQRDESLSDVVRLYTEAGLQGTLNSDNIDFISGIIREQIKITMQPQIERLASLSAKAYMEAATASLLTAETISRFVDDSKQEALQDVYEKARKKAVATARKKED